MKSLLLLIGTLYSICLLGQASISGSEEVFSGQTSSYYFTDEGIDETTDFEVSVTNGRIEGSNRLTIYESSKSTSFTVIWNKVADGETSNGTILVKKVSDKSLVASLVIKVKGYSKPVDPTKPPGPTNPNFSNNPITPYKAYGYVVGDTIEFYGPTGGTDQSTEDKTEWEYPSHIFKEISRNKKEIVLVCVNKGQFALYGKKEFYKRIWAFKRKYKGELTYLSSTYARPVFTPDVNFYALYNGSEFTFYNYQLSHDTNYGNKPKIKEQLLTNEPLPKDFSGWIDNATYSVTFFAESQFKFKLNKRVWVGKPLVKNVDNSQEIDHRSSIVIPPNVDGVFDAKWECVTGFNNYEFIEQDIHNAITIKPKLKANESGIIVLKCIASNKGGEVTTFHTININKARGTSLDYPIEFGVIDKIGDIYGAAKSESKSVELCYYTLPNSSSIKMYYSFQIGSQESLVNFLSFKKDVVSGRDTSSKISIYEEYNGQVSLIETIETDYSDSEHFYDHFEDLDLYTPLTSGKYYLVIEVSPRPNEILYTQISHLYCGAYRFQPISFPTALERFHFSDTRDSSPRPYDNILTEYPFEASSKEIFYKFNITNPMDIRVHTIGSMHGGVKVYLCKYNPNEEFYPRVLYTGWYSPILQANWLNTYEYLGFSDPIEINNLSSGEYYLIIEGYKASNGGSYNGLLNVTIDGYPVGEMPSKLKANPNSDPQMAKPYSLGARSTLTLRANTKEDGYFNVYSYINNNKYITPSNAKEVYHKIVTTEPLDLIIHHGESKLPNTLIHLISDDGFFYSGKSTPIATTYGVQETNPHKLSSLGEKQSYLEVDNLPPGTYYIISEGFGEELNGELTINIQANKPRQTAAPLVKLTDVGEPVSIILTPNPANSMVELIVDTKIEFIQGSYQIISIGGSTQQKGQIRGKTTQIDISKLSLGVYIVHAVVNGKNLSTQLMVK